MEKSQESLKNKIKNIGGGGSLQRYMGLKVQLFIMFSSNKKYKWLTVIFKYGKDDHVICMYVYLVPIQVFKVIRFLYISTNLI
jgi:hypothetical protein